MFGQPSLLDGVDPGRDLRTESLGREHFAFERKNLSAVSLRSIARSPAIRVCISSIRTCNRLSWSRSATYSEFDCRAGIPGPAGSEAPRTITTEKVKNKPINNLRHIISTI